MTAELIDLDTLPAWDGGGLDVALTAAVNGVAAVQTCLAAPGTTVTGGHVRALERLARRLDAARLAAIAAVDSAGIAAGSGAAGTGAWLAGATRSDGATAARQVRLALVLDAALPATRGALARGDISVDHAQVIARTMQVLPGDVTAAERDRVERSLIAKARVMDPARLRRAARRVLEAVERPSEDVDAHHDQSLHDEEERAGPKTRLVLRDNGDGTTTGHFTVPTLAARILAKIIQQMTSPRRTGPGSQNGHATTTGGTTNASADASAGSGTTTGGTTTSGATTSGAGASAGTAGRPAARQAPEWAQGQANPAPAASGQAASGQAASGQAASGQAASGQAASGQGPAGRGAPGQGAAGQGTDWAHAHGQAFVELLEHLPTDHLTGKVAATVVVTLDLDQLRAGLGAAGLDTSGEITAGEVRRLACQAGIVPAVLGARSLPLDLGRTTRLFTDTQRLALATVYDTCAATGCDRPYAWTELHHQHPWAGGGRTDLTHAVPACRFHHQLIHNPRYRHTITTHPDGRKTITYEQRC